MESRIIAAVDLGSNSFHMVIARVVGHEPRIIDRLRIPVRLAAGLDESGAISPAAVSRALSCLDLFSKRLRAHARVSVRAVGTNTFRLARSPKRFRAQCEATLGFPIEIVPGREEARLIHLGVVRSEKMPKGRHFIVDIGGGSTECIIGEGRKALRTESLQMGSVSYTERFFPDGLLDAQRMEAATVAAAREIQTIRSPFRTLGFEAAFGASGTVLAVASILSPRGKPDGAITAAGLAEIARELIRAKQKDALDYPGLRPDRVAALPGGVAILGAVMRGLGIDQLAPAAGALREGVLHDLIGRIHHEDSRDETIRRFSERYVVDLAQAARVSRTARNLFRQMARKWRLVEEDRHVLDWACAVHEAGMLVSYSGYQKHGAYLIENSDLPGFGGSERSLVAAIVRAHRRKMSAETFERVDEEDRERALRLSIILRLSVVLNRSRVPPKGLRFRLEAGPSGRLVLRFPASWLQHHPLVAGDLEDEQEFLKGVGIRLVLA